MDMGYEDAPMSRKTERPSFVGSGRRWRADWEQRRLRKRVAKALTMAPRGGIAGDGMLLRTMSLSLSVEWYARDLHPWDRDLPVERRAKLFAADLMADTVVAIRQMFERLAEIDAIQVRVLEPTEPHETVLAGTVCRDDLNATRDCRSPAMSLKLLGVQQRVTNNQQGYLRATGPRGR
jgi:hypothetical protein